MAFTFLPALDDQDNEPASAEILEFPPLWQAQAEVRRCQLVVDQCTTTIETRGAGRLRPDIAIAVAESLLPNYTRDLVRAEATVAALSAGTALTHNGVIYAATVGMA